MTEEALRVRRALPGDAAAVMALVPRLVDFGPPWRDRDGMRATDRRVVGEALRAEGDDPVVLVAVLGEEVVGFVHLHSIVDYYRGERHGHVADLVVAEGAEGKGVGRRLLAAAEDWARGRGFDWLGLAVFEANARALGLYEGTGFRRDMLRMVKPLGRGRWST
ncbi:MAG: GNAT family N-acetyltransferase [Geminicoccaceae bacterium]|nr:GNAT family N-acetyltransferase [Geminicoccaceae bacterium]